MSVSTIFMVVASIACLWRRNGEKFILGPTHFTSIAIISPVLKLVNFLHFLHYDLCIVAKSLQSFQCS